MCFDPVTMAIVVGTATALSGMVSDKLQMDAANNAAVHNYNAQARNAEMVNRNAILQQQETDARNRTERLRQSEAALDKTRSQILENRRAMATARASAGTSGLMGLPLNMIEQNYQSLIGGLATNLESYNTQLDENYFFNSMDSMLRAQSITNQAIPNKPYLQKFGWGNVLSGGLRGITAGLGSYNPGAGTSTASNPSFSSNSFSTAQPIGPVFEPNPAMGGF